MSRRQSHLVLALSRRSWGRPNTARAVAEELAVMGDGVVFISLETLAGLLMMGAGFQWVTICANMGPLLGLYLNDLIAHHRPDDVILSDYLGNAEFFACNGTALHRAIPADVRTLVIDAFDAGTTGRKIDLFGDETDPLGFTTAEEWERFVFASHRMIPAPLGNTASTAPCFCNLPSPPPVLRRPRFLELLGLPASAKIVLLCTAEWQHTRFQEEQPGRHISDALPSFLAHHLSQLGTSVHLLHVGPSSFDLAPQLPDRYHWLPPMPPEQFDSLLANSDLALSANISGTTIGRAMVFGVPNLVLQNSVAAKSLDEAQAAAPAHSSLFLRNWLATALPLFPFALWPIGYHSYLAPLIRDNPYCDAVDLVELLDEERFHARLAALLFSAPDRAEHIHRQHCYVARIRSLPTGGELVRQLTGRQG